MAPGKLLFANLICSMRLVLISGATLLSLDNHPIPSGKFSKFKT